MSSHFNNSPIVFLEREDFHDDGSLKMNQGLKPMVIMVMGNFCGFCKRAAPMFVDFAKQNPHVIAATIVIDGKQSEKDLYKLINSKITRIPGVPTFMLFKNGKFVAIHSGERTKESLLSFCS